MLTELISSGPLPELVTVKTSGALALFTGWLGKVSDVGSTKMAGAPPVPDRVIVWELLGSESMIINEALRAPVTMGLKVTVIVHDPFPEIFAPQVFVWLKSPGSAPPKVMFVTPIAAVLPLVIVVCMVAVIPTFTSPKLSAVGEMVSALTPDPLKGTL
jgi:hypothetical protein